MRRLILALGTVALLSGGCARGIRDTSLYQLSGRQKPIVAVLPVLDNTGEHYLSWDLSREFTDEIRKRVYNSKKIYLLRDGGSREIATLLSTPNPYAIAGAAAESLGAAQYAVVAEIIEQDEAPYGMNRLPINNPSKAGAGSLLSLVLRVRVIDMRRETPKVILQEVVDKDYVISRAYMNCDYNKMAWGTEAFTHTPMGIAHNHLVRELVARIEAYIEAVQ